jgi:uncharacterized membrane protein
VGTGTDTGASARGYGRDSVEFSRAIAFFDAVYAFAVTLLVVNLDPPAASDWSSLATLLDSGLEWQLLGFAISFVVIAAFWRVNHRIVAGFRGLSSATIVANLVATAFVVLIPFTTQGISDIDTSDEPLAIALYAVNISCAMLAQSAMYYVALHDGMVAHPLPRRAAVARVLDVLVTPAVFLASIPIAYAFGAAAARYTWALLIVLSPISGMLASRRIERVLAEESRTPERS